MMMKIVIDNGRRGRQRRRDRAAARTHQLSDFHANGHEMESARLPGPVAGAGAGDGVVDLSATNVLEPENERHFNASRH